MCIGKEGASAAAAMPVPDVVRDEGVFSSPRARYFNACRTAIEEHKTA
jgi:hypothetical protein